MSNRMKAHVNDLRKIKC